MYRLISVPFILLLIISNNVLRQTLQDNFDGYGNISIWEGDNCNIDTSFNNPFSSAINSSTKVLKYDDYGSAYANVKFDIGRNLNLSQNNVISLKIYVPSSGITGTQNNQVSLKLQNGNLTSPWSNQTEVIKNIILNQWQTVTFDFANDPYINFDASSPAPILRTDFNRVLIQVNGENNTDQLIAYIDDFIYYDTVVVGPTFNQLVWSDEFNANGAISNVNWFHQTQLPGSGSWFNGEQQHYTNRINNSIVSNGNLNIIAKKEVFSDQGQTKNYTSARLNSKFAFKYGKVEVRAKLPSGVGTWPAIWTLGKNINEAGAYFQTQGHGTTTWPACGEIDIMEHWGGNQNFVQSAMHTPSSFGATVNHGGQSIQTASSNFHVYTLEWTKDKMVFSVDNTIHYTYNPVIKDASTWPFDKEQYLLLNFAIQPSIASSFTKDTLIIDYVRVYKESFVSINEIERRESHNIYPNPVKNELTIQLKQSSNQLIKFSIYSVSGVLVHNEMTYSNNKFFKIKNLGNLPKGLYLVRYSIDNIQYVNKFIKK